MVRFTGTGTGAVVLVIATTGCDPFRARAHLALCARAILRRDAADITRLGWLVVPVPFNDSMTEIAWSMLSTRACACLRSARSCWSALLRFRIVPPSVFDR